MGETQGHPGEAPTLTGRPSFSPGRTASLRGGSWGSSWCGDGRHSPCLRGDASITWGAQAQPLLSAVGNPDARAPGKKKRGGRGAKGGEKLSRELAGGPGPGQFLLPSPSPVCSSLCNKQPGASHEGMMGPHEEATRPAEESADSGAAPVGAWAGWLRHLLDVLCGPGPLLSFPENFFQFPSLPVGSIYIYICFSNKYSDWLVE